MIGFYNLIQVLGVKKATEKIVVNKTGTIPVFLELTVYLSTGGNACLQHQENRYTMVVYLWDLNVDFINWYLAQSIPPAQHGTY